MTLPPTLRRAYERGRLARAAGEALPVALLPLAGLCLSEPRPGPAILACGLPVCFAIARWRGQSWARGALIGVIAGAPALLGPLCVSALGLPCAEGDCARWGTILCVSVGALAGTAVGCCANEPRALGTALGFALVCAALGCLPLGGGVVLGALGALLLGLLGAQIARRVMV